MQLGTGMAPTVIIKNIDNNNNGAKTQLHRYYCYLYFFYESIAKGNDRAHRSQAW